MYDIRHRVGIGASLTEVYDTLATLEGGTRWWTADVTGDAAVGGRLTFGFPMPERGATMEIAELAPPSRVAWRCVAGPDEWVGTRITFDLRAEGDETVVLFTHRGWREPVEFMSHCSTKWGYFLLSLKHVLEDGTGTPWPDDEHISSWG